MSGRLVRALALAWLAIAAVLIAGHAPDLVGGPMVRKIDAWFLFHQDLPALWGIAAAALAALMASFVLPRTAPARPPPGLAPDRARLIVWALAAGVAALAWTGTFAVMDAYPLSMDEFMAGFDARILAHGRLMAPVAPPWRDLMDALQPEFTTHAPGDVAWSSQYLPVNAALRALGGLAGASSLVSPLLAAFAVLALYAIGRRVWPERPRLALAAAALLATSPQFLLTAMTPYAMTAHLAFNLAWLWLFLKGGRAGHAGALGVGFLACGLHQFVFHPLFAAPFVLELIFARRWRLAALYGLAYAAFLAFWIGYWPMAFALQEAGADRTGLAAAASHGLYDRVKPLLDAFRWSGAVKMDENLIRFVTWQNLLVAPLAAIGAVRSLWRGGVFRPLTIGLVLTAGFMFLVIPYQGHGWGYRYWHGLLGSTALLAAFGWQGLTARSDAAGARWLFAGLTAVSALALVPLRAWQAHAFIEPYARAEAAVARSPTDIVLVDPAGAWFASDLMRNDPFLENRPLILDVRALDADDLAPLCARHSVSLFDGADARSFGIRPTARLPRGPAPALDGANCRLSPWRNPG